MRATALLGIAASLSAFGSMPTFGNAAMFRPPQPKGGGYAHGCKRAARKHPCGRRRR